MILSQDMQDFVRLLNSHAVKYAVVGGHAVNYYGYPRFTQDLDILILPSSENALKMVNVLAEFGFGSAGIPASAFEKPGTAIHLGQEPNRIDLLTTVVGVDVSELMTRIISLKAGEQAVYLISLPDLIRVKKASSRLKDLADAEELEKLAQK